MTIWLIEDWAVGVKKQKTKAFVRRKKRMNKNEEITLALALTSYDVW